MTCPAEWNYALYLDGELPADEVRPLEAHLVQCRACRALVVALREEASLLADALHERAPRAPRAAPRTAPPPRALAAGLLPMLSLGALGLAVLGSLVGAGLPAGLAWLNPFRPDGAYEMAFDLLFLIRDEVPGLLRLLVALAAVGSVSMLLLVALSVVARRLTGTAGLGLLALAPSLAAVAADPGAALDLRFHESEVVVAEGETTERTMVVNADTVRVDGVVDGDLVVVLAERLLLRGEVRGNVFASARTIEVSGRVRGNLHTIGEKVRLDGEVAGNLYSLSELVTTSSGARVGRDSTHVAHGAEVEGSVGRDLFVLGEWAELRGKVGRDVDVRVDRVSLLDGARVGGDVDALFFRPNQVKVEPGATVAGEVRSRLHEEARASRLERYARAGYYAVLVLRLGAAFAFGMLLYVLFPSLFAVHVETAGELLRSMGVGFLAAVATPVALVVAAATLLGIPVALFGLAAFVCGLYVSGILIAALVGTQVTRPAAETLGAFALALLVGLVIAIVAGELPFVGFPIRLLIVLTGLGLVFERLRSAWRAARFAPGG